MGEIMSGRIEEKIDLVVGEAQVVGEAIAKRFVKEGARAVIADVWNEVGQLQPNVLLAPMSIRTS
jgi:NAD(P)-dependent dehydrogenase (short-subunit alcohol dehydrogenase family)